MTLIAIVDYGVGNLGSILNMFKRVGADARLCRDPATLSEYDRVLLPGVGAFDNAMTKLDEAGFVDQLEKARVQGKPVMGVCLGMQLLTASSEEGQIAGLGWLPAKTLRFEATSGLKIPHMGWNHVDPIRASPLFAGLEEAPRFYFLHSFYVTCADTELIVGETVYGESFVSVFAQENIFGVQFHPEKSHRFGMQLFKNFADLPA